MTEHERRELEPPSFPLSRGSHGPDVKRLQEWLSLHGFHTTVDGAFGPATEAAVKRFQTSTELEHHVNVGWTYGEVAKQMWRMLVFSIGEAIEWLPHKAASAGHNIVDCAHAHLAARPREAGIPNGGPWVRLYMDGHEGKDWPWCAGFATYVLRQALRHDRWRTFSCDELAAIAQRRGLFLRGGLRAAGFGPSVTPGSLFLIRNSAPDQRDDWIHCGIVTAVGAEHFETIEGNTNQGGSREGTEVCKRHRAFNGRTDFILTGDGA
jgi:hypothetical protein